MLQLPTPRGRQSASTPLGGVRYVPRCLNNGSAPATSRGVAHISPRWLLWGQAG